YSTLWLALACRELGRKLVTFEVLEEKAGLAKETFKVAGVENVVKLVRGDARKHLENYRDISFCFLDAEKDAYYDCYEKIVPNMVKGGLLVADNAISHKEELEEMIKRALDDRRVDALIVPIGRGELVCRKI
ncbi:O-methyltransferase, partial [Candidatus Saccharibacteria bacterium]|nr:O-methyltransferase [candidate division Zixibacteria bacterium]NIT04127.1 O-methyltransferase [Candidatus Saccharibacteria bacterium]